MSELTDNAPKSGHEGHPNHDHHHHGDRDHHHHHEPKKVTVTVDNKPKRVWPKSYIVSVFKQKVGVAADRELDEIVNGEIKPLDDKATITIKGGEHFISHVRTGHSS